MDQPRLTLLFLLFVDIYLSVSFLGVKITLHNNLSAKYTIPVEMGCFRSRNAFLCYLTTPFSFLQLFLCSEFFSFSPCITRRQNFYFLPILSNQENSVLQGNKVSYSIESWKWGIFRQRKLFCNGKNIFSTWLPCIQHWFSSLNSMQPFGQGWAFLPFNKPAGLFQGKNAHPCPHGSILFHEENQFFMQGHQLHSVFLLAPELFLCLHTPHFRDSIE